MIINIFIHKVIPSIIVISPPSLTQSVHHNDKRQHHYIAQECVCSMNDSEVVHIKRVVTHGEYSNIDFYWHKYTCVHLSGETSTAARLH